MAHGKKARLAAWSAARYERSRRLGGNDVTSTATAISHGTTVLTEEQPTATAVFHLRKSAHICG
jgi:predicted nucleic acid-binding protein